MTSSIVSKQLDLISLHATKFSDLGVFGIAKLSPSSLQRIRSPLRVSSMSEHQRVTISNPSGERLVGILEGSGSNEVIILCHGFRSSKRSSTLTSLATMLTKNGYSLYRFDFSGNGESDGEFMYGNYWKEVEDLRSVILFWRSQGHSVKAIIGHSKGGDVVLLYASKYSDVTTIVNLSGRFDLQNGVKERLGEKGLQMIADQGYLEVKNSNGEVEYRVTKESLQERLNTDMKSAVLSIPKECRILTIHGTDDEIVNVEDAKQFDRLISNHKLQIFEGADHGFTGHEKILASCVQEFINAKV